VVGGWQATHVAHPLYFWKGKKLIELKENILNKADVIKIVFQYIRGPTSLG